MGLILGDGWLVVKLSSEGWCGGGFDSGYGGRGWQKTQRQSYDVELMQDRTIGEGVFA